MKHTIKIVLGTIVLLGIIMQGVELYFKPSALLLENSKTYPEWLSWFQWIITLLSAVGYFLLDCLEKRRHKSC